MNVRPNRRYEENEGSTSIVVAPSVLHIIGVPLLTLAVVAVGLSLVWLKEILVRTVCSCIIHRVSIAANCDLSDNTVRKMHLLLTLCKA